MGVPPPPPLTHTYTSLAPHVRLFASLPPPHHTSAALLIPSLPLKTFTHTLFLFTHSLPPPPPQVYLHQRELNEVYTGGIGSYALIIMVAAFLHNHPSRRSKRAWRACCRCWCLFLGGGGLFPGPGAAVV